MWIIERIINNNVISASNKQGLEVILTGKGIGFQKKVGDTVDDKKIERVFVPEQGIDPEYILDASYFVNTIIQMIEQHFKIKIDPSWYEYGIFTNHLKYLAQKVFDGVEDEMDDDDFYRSVQKKHYEAYECVKKMLTFIKEHYQFSLSEEEKMYLTVYVKRILIRGKKI